jgi:hypothetical protein
MKSFKTFIIEKANLKTTHQWEIVTLDDNTELAINLQLLVKSTIQINMSGKSSKTVMLGKDAIKSIEAELGYKLPVDDVALNKFLSMLPCPCDN